MAAGLYGPRVRSAPCDGSRGLRPGPREGRAAVDGPPADAAAAASSSRPDPAPDCAEKTGICGSEDESDIAPTMVPGGSVAVGCVVATGVPGVCV